jgi:hypothetical protein
MLTNPEAVVQRAHNLSLAVLEIGIISCKVHKNSLQKVFVIPSATSPRREKEEQKQELLTYFPPFPRLANLLKIKYPEGR